MYKESKGPPTKNLNKGYENPPLKNLNKGYGSESLGQEKKNLMNDDPIVSRASKGSFMTKHSHSSSSPLGMYDKEM